MAWGDVKSGSTDEIRMRNHRALAEQRHEIEMEQLKDKQSEELQRTIEDQAYRSEKLKHDYEVQISSEAERLEERLRSTRENGDAKIAETRAAKEQELARLKSSYQQQLEDYRKNSEEQLERLRKELQRSTQALHEQAKAAERSKNTRT